NPFADATWDEAWKTSAVNDERWSEIRSGLRAEAHRWLAALGSPREVRTVELSGMIGSITHLAYHLGAMRQIATNARGPREGAALTWFQNGPSSRPVYTIPKAARSSSRRRMLRRATVWLR